MICYEDTLAPHTKDFTQPQSYKGSAASGTRVALEVRSTVTMLKANGSTRQALVVALGR